MSGRIKHKQRSCYSYHTNKGTMGFVARRSHIRASRIEERKQSKGLFAKLVEAAKNVVGHRTTEK